MIAAYPDDVTIHEPIGRKKKNKGKQREDPWQGLLRIDEGPPPAADHIGTEVHDSANPTVAGPSGTRSRTTPNSQPSDDSLVRIDMGQMSKLKEMGYEVFGPVNGPNEGYPEYEVQKRVLDNLQAHGLRETMPNPSSPEVRNLPEPAHTIDPILDAPDTDRVGHHLDSVHSTGVMPDGPHIRPEVNRDDCENRPLLGDAMANEPARSTLPSGTAHPNTEARSAISTNVRPTTPPYIDAGSAMRQDVHPTTPPKKRGGKRPQVNLSPAQGLQTWGQKKKRKVTDDDLAAIEAQNMVQSGSRRRGKATRRH